MAMLVILRIILGGLFLMAGSVKNSYIGNAVFPGAHKHMESDFNRMVGVSPLNGLYKMSAAQYRDFVGYIEIICGMCLMTGMCSKIGTIMLMIVMTGALYTHLSLGDPPAVMIVPAGLLLTLAVILYAGATTKEKTE